MQDACAARATSAASYHLPGTAALLRALCTLFDRKEHAGEAPPASACAHVERAAARARHRANLENYRVHFHVAAPERGAVAGAACMSLWCMSAGVVMQRLQAMGVASMLLTSGTLSPLPATAEELVVPMQVRLENPHVVAAEQVRAAFGCSACSAAHAAQRMQTHPARVQITPRAQVMCSVLCQGPGGAQLNGSFANRGSSGYKRDLGAALVRLAAAVPHGMLLFFPSYAAMKALTEEWQAWPQGRESLWRQLEAHKPIFQEPRGGSEFARVRATWLYTAACRTQALAALRCISGLTAADMRRWLQVIEGYRGKVAESRRGALLMAVCQGRVSEGIDFSDAEGRAVVVAGVPFAPAKDARVLCKRAVLDARRRDGRGTLSGQHWYTLSAMRVVNQALGRVIRHRHDYGAILLADERFARPDMRQGISFWARSFLGVRAAFGDTAAELERFFRANEVREGVAAPARPRGDAGRTMFGQAAAPAVAKPAAAAKRGGGRPAFQPPKRAAAGGGKVGAAESGASALRALENTMHVAAAKDVYGSGFECSQPQVRGRHLHSVTLSVCHALAVNALAKLMSVSRACKLQAVAKLRYVRRAGRRRSAWRTRPHAATTRLQPAPPARARRTPRHSARARPLRRLRRRLLQRRRAA